MATCDIKHEKFHKLYDASLPRHVVEVVIQRLHSMTVGRHYATHASWSGPIPVLDLFQLIC